MIGFDEVIPILLGDQRLGQLQRWCQAGLGLRIRSTGISMPI
jgi:hypothetical protein